MPEKVRAKAGMKQMNVLCATIGVGICDQALIEGSFGMRFAGDDRLPRS